MNESETQKKKNSVWDSFASVLLGFVRVVLVLEIFNDIVEVLEKFIQHRVD